MNFHPITLAALATVLTATLAHAANAPALNAKQIYERSISTERVNDWQAESTLEIRQGDRARVRGGMVYNKLQSDGVRSRRLFRFRTPVDISGTAVLVHENTGGEDDLWIYFPSMAKTRRILASNKKDSFMGSDFSYADLMAQDTSNFVQELLPEEACGQARCYRIQSTPRDEKIAASLGYAKIVASIRTDQFTTMQVRYYDRDGNEFKQQLISGYVPAAGQAGRFVATRREMIMSKGGRRSVLVLKNVDAARSLSPDQFVESRLGR